MGKNKLQKFNDMAGFTHVFQYPFAALQAHGGCPLKGRWRAEVFKNDYPITLELGCGRGEYTVGLGRLYPNRNFVGIDVKGARMWAGAKESLETGMKNVAFLRTEIELINQFFERGEINEIWLTFPDPQIKKTNKRLTGTRFIRLYQNMLPDDGVVHLKTDSPFMYAYTREMTKVNRFPVKANTENLYQSGMVDSVLSIRTCYEQQWLERGLDIKYISFVCEPRDVLVEPDIEIEPDPYRSYNRSRRSASPSTNCVI